MIRPNCGALAAQVSPALLVALIGCGEAPMDSGQVEPPAAGPVVLTPALADSPSASFPEGRAVAPCEGIESLVIPIQVVDFWFIDLPDRRSALTDRLVADFARATDCAVQIDILDTVDAPVPLHDTSEILARYPDMGEMDAQRLWYHESDSVRQILVDLRTALESVNAMPAPSTIVVALSEAQFEASAYYIPEDAEGLEPLILIESHTLGGWSLGPDYTSASHDAVYLSDEIIHELGHHMGLRHACASCFQLGDYQAMLACCDACPHADDVMSYCRDRLRPGDEETHVFGMCTLEWIESAFAASAAPSEPGPVQAMACED